MQMNRVASMLLLGMGISVSSVADSFSLEQQEMRAQLTASRYTTLSAELGAKIAAITMMKRKKAAAAAAGSRRIRRHTAFLRRIAAIAR